jgi:signal peptidase I
MKRDDSKGSKGRKGGRRSAADGASPRGRGAGTKKSAVREWIEVVVVGLLVVSLFRGVVAQAYQIPSGSMENTLLIGDFLFINKMIYGAELAPGIHGNNLFDIRFPAFRKPKRGDIIVFRYPVNPAVDYIKRCIATEGETLEIRDKAVYVDGKKLDEPYAIHSDPRVIPRGGAPRDNFGPLVVPKGCIFMMGDNRDNSYDSRFWGPLPIDEVKGKAMFLYLSWDGERMMPRFNRFFRPLH